MSLLDASPSSSLAKLLPSDPRTQQAAWWGLAAASAVAAGATFWWLTRESYYSYVPIQARLRCSSVAQLGAKAEQWGRVCGVQGAELCC